MAESEIAKQGTATAQPGPEVRRRSVVDANGFDAGAERPSGVPADAVCYPPTIMSPAMAFLMHGDPSQPVDPRLLQTLGFADIQGATIQRVQAIIDQQNAAEDLHFAGRMLDWQTNAAIYASLGMPIPDPPKHARIVLYLNWATKDGSSRAKSPDSAGNRILTAPTWDCFVWAWERSVLVPLIGAGR